MKRVFSILTVLASILSCKVDHPAPSVGSGTDGESPSRHIPTDFHVSLPGCGTRTAVDMSTGIITWLTDDPIMVSNGNEQITMYVEEGGDTYAGLYSTEDVIEGSSFFAVYPAENAGWSDGVFSSMISPAQTYSRNGFSSGTFPMVAICDGNRNFSFRNAAALLKIKTSAELFSDSGISSVIITADEALAGPISVSYNSIGSEPLVNCTDGVNRVSVSAMGQTVPFGEPIYAVVAPGEYHNMRVTLVLSNGLGFSCGVDGTVSVNRSAYREISVTVNDNYTDLSSEESANCYHIARAGGYKFRADVKGNGVETSCGLPARTENISAARMYYSDGGEFLTGGFGYHDGYIYFNTAGDPLPSGTALVSAVDGDGNTLWSWHIWANAALEDVALSDGSVWLNMNLGAHQIRFNAKGYNGFYYQWGRKDPFLQKYTADAKAATFLPFVSHASQTDGSLENSIANPHIFYGGFHPSGVTDITEDWCTYEDDVKVYDWWNVNIDRDNQLDAKAGKTMFDPCPAGYHVPVYTDLAALFEMTKNNSSSDDEGRTVEGKLFFPYTSYRYAILHTAWWPGGSSEDSRIFIPCANPYNTGDRHTRKIPRLYMTSHPSQGMNNNGVRSYGFPVRCIKDATNIPSATIENMTTEQWK